MNKMESSTLTLEKPKKGDPTFSDVEELEIKTNNLVGGDIVHKKDNLMGTLRKLIETAEIEGGWDDSLRDIWNRAVTEIYQMIAKVR